MKRLFLIVIALALLVGVSYAASGSPEPRPPAVINNDPSQLEKNNCPKTRMSMNCTTCHTVPDFKLKEVSPENKYEYPLSGISIMGDTAYYVIQNIHAGQVQTFFNYVAWHKEVKKISLEIFSLGGSLFDGYKIVGMMQEMKTRGYIIETRCYGFGASAGFLIFASGTKGHRFISRIAEGMWHELITFEMFKVSGPADKEDEAKVLRHLQDGANEFLSSVSNLTKEEIDSLIRKQEFWMNGLQAVTFGFADGLLE